MCTALNVLDFWEGEERVERKFGLSTVRQTFKIFQSAESSQAKDLSLQETFRKQSR